MWAIFGVLSGTVYLLTIVLSIPIAFDVGGRDSGLAYSLSIFLFYFLYSFIKAITPQKSTVRWTLTNILRIAQWIVLPSLLIWSLNRFSVDTGSSDWVSRTLGHIRPVMKHTDSWHEWFFGQGGLLEHLTLGAWDKGLRYSSPVFQLLEGFCSLLVIQAAGQITRWLVNRGRSDTWVIILVVFSGSIMASALYFLWRVARFPQISNLDATLIGVTMTSAVFLCAFGIGSGRGNPVESSLLFAYVVLCVYQIFTDYLPSAEAAAAAQAAAEEQAAASQPEFPPLPPIIMASYATFLHMLSQLPGAFSDSFTFLWAAFQTITPSVIISLVYRIIVFYCATRIIPAVRESGASALMDEPSNFDDSSDAANKLFTFVSWFSPSILIAVYTSLLLQHFSVSADGGIDSDGIGWTLRGGDAGGNAWRWTNVAATMALYAVELYLGKDEVDHWKTD
ncbi:hypothetical protein M406DRAFT_283124 [Cryphonectria parasitica EP155]|uniref:ER membrane protein n=1 Tax=Cryphonectria parasitica (strain ATCC 38755 / EP155) TaxID=660469 RepID=A0A9P4XUH9_CRYP1|nr:uncharacterized protein M406DRAFT_283124 [Cryphonectria parasitica EP155]KAF3761161.1 hypothetical protein M406DRAFT_283124 [Cryphonectria parasitica EP155]